MLIFVELFFWCWALSFFFNTMHEIVHYISVHFGTTTGWKQQLGAECGLTTYTLFCNCKSEYSSSFELKLKVIKFFERAASTSIVVYIYISVYMYLCIVYIIKHFTERPRRPIRPTTSLDLVFLLCQFAIINSTKFC